MDHATNTQKLEGLIESKSPIWALFWKYSILSHDQQSARPKIVVGGGTKTWLNHLPSQWMPRGNVERCSREIFAMFLALDKTSTSSRKSDANNVAHSECFSELWNGGSSEMREIWEPDIRQAIQNLRDICRVNKLHLSNRVLLGMSILSTRLKSSMRITMMRFEIQRNSCTRIGNRDISNFCFHQRSIRDGLKIILLYRLRNYSLRNSRDRHWNSEGDL